MGVANALTLRWTVLEALPPDWSVRLSDLVTGTEIDLRALASYAFRARASDVPAGARGADAAPVRETRSVRIIVVR